MSDFMLTQASEEIKALKAENKRLKDELQGVRIYAAALLEENEKTDITKKPKQMSEKIEDFKFSNWEDYAKTLKAENEGLKADLKATIRYIVLDKVRLGYTEKMANEIVEHELLTPAEAGKK